MIKNNDEQRVSLVKVIQKIKFISENEYDSNIYENIMLIFNQLSIRERTVLLRGLIGFCFIVEDQLSGNKDIKQEIKKDIKESTKTIESEIQDLNTINALELIKLKSWFVRTLTWVIIIGVFLFILFNVFTTDGTTSAFPYFDDLFKIFKIMMGG